MSLALSADTDPMVATPRLPQNCPILMCQGSAELFSAGAPGPVQKPPYHPMSRLE
jgi:hypothetical protein